ncbi:hypothetical protein JCM18899A_51500 [Nocardioides sp. AN3]|jgi:hypothetical protein
MCIGLFGVAKPDRAYEEYRDRPSPGVPTRVEVRFRPTAAHGAQLVAEMLNGAADDISPIGLRARHRGHRAPARLGTAPLPSATHMSEQLSYPG